MGPRQIVQRQEAHVSAFHLHPGQQAFPGHCSRGLPPRAFRPPAAWGWRGARWGSSSRPGLCVLPARPRSPSPEPPEDTGKKIPSCKNKHGSPTCFCTGLPSSLFLLFSAALGPSDGGPREGGAVEFVYPAGSWDVATPGSERRESCRKTSWGKNVILADFPGEGRHVGSPLWCHPEASPAALPGSGLTPGSQR